MGDPNQPIIHRLGGGDDRRIEFMTDGRVQTELHPTEPIWSHKKVSTEPTANASQSHTFFRLDENSKWQYCVLFPSGLTQILATEP